MPNFIFRPTSSFEFSTMTEAAPYWVTHTKLWADILENSFPQIKGYIASDSEIINHDSSFLPIYKINRPFSRTSWISIPYATISDPIINHKSMAEPLLTSLLANPTINKFEIRTLFELQMTSKFSTFSGFLNHQLIIDGDEDAIFKRFHRTAVQTHIQKSLQSGLSLKIATTLKEVETFYHLYTVMRRELGLPPQPYCFFKNMWDRLYPNNNVELLMAEKDGNVIAGIWVLKNKWLYSFEYLARAGQKEKMRCDHFLYWQGIKRAINSQIKIVSFGRTSAKNKGLDQFKRRWGTIALPYYDLTYPGTSKPREDQKLYKIIRKIAPALPIPLFRLLGDIIYKLI